jgi:cytochrome-b5 reductase
VVAEEKEYASSCYLPTDWTELPLLEKKEYNHDSTLYDFGLPEDTSLNLPACACILLLAPGADKDGADAIRPYTPISSNNVKGRFQLLVKRYAQGAVSQYLHGLELGAKVSFKHIIFNVKRQYPFEPAKTISLLCAGTGIAPIYQALLRLMNEPGDDRKVVLLYGNKSPSDILLKEELDAMAKKADGRLKIVHVVGETPDAAAPAGWESTSTYIAESGWIDEAKIKKHCFPPSEDTAVFVCGLPVQYDAWCGPRTEPELAEGTVLHKLGYTTATVAKM